jgi:tetratricopeptide (TPR) repeat protein
MRETQSFVVAKTGFSPSARGTRLLHEATGGNPFFLTQLLPVLRAGHGELEPRAVASLPETARDAIAQQLDCLSESTRDVLTVGAVIGREFNARVLNHLRSMAPEMLAPALEEAKRAGIVTEQEGALYKFSHILVRDVIYERLSAKERATLHRRIADSLESLYDVEVDTYLSEIAHHYVEAASTGVARKAVEYCERAGRYAGQRLAYDDAVEHYRRGVAVYDRHLTGSDSLLCDLLLRLGSEQARSGDRKGAKETFERAARAAERLGAPDRLADAALGVAPGFFAVEAGVRDEFLLGLLRRSLASLSKKHAALESRLCARLGMALFWSEETRESSALGMRAWEIASSLGDPSAQLFALYGRWLAEWHPYDLDSRYAVALRAVGLAREVGDREMLIVCKLFSATCNLELGDIVSFDRETAEFRVLAEELKQPQCLWYSHLLRATRALHGGRFEEAEEEATAFYEIGRRIGDVNALHSMMAQRFLVAAERGNFESVLNIAEEGCSRHPVFVGWQAGRLWALAKLGDLESARRELALLGETNLEAIPRKMDWPLAMALLSEVCALTGDQSVARRLFDLMLPMQGRVVVLGLCVMSWGAVERYLGLLAQAMGRYEEACTWFERAIAANSRVDAQPWIAHCEVDYSRLLLSRANDGDEKRAQRLVKSAESRRRISRPRGRVNVGDDQYLAVKSAT